MSSLTLGLFIGIGAIFVSVLLDGGALHSLFNVSALVIVLGGTLGAAIICHSLGDVLGSVTRGLRLLGTHTPTPMDVVRLFVDLSGRARREGLLALEAIDLEDPFIQESVQMVVDAVDEDYLHQTLTLHIEGEQLAFERTASVFETLGSYSPTLGIVGTVIGLVHVLGNLEDPQTVGPAIATAFTATLYGIGFANLVFLPVGARLKAQAAQLYIARNLIVEGTRALMRGLNPRMVERKLAGILYGEPLEEEEGEPSGAAGAQEPSTA